MPVPPYLQPKKTKLDAGPDESLTPSERPTNPLVRQRPPSQWPVVNRAAGGTDPPDGPLGPPATDPARRSLPPFEWARHAESNRSLILGVPVPDLDPDIALWPANIVNRWPFSGPPTTGIWPLGWMGVDNTATLYICTQSGAPGTWVAVGGSGINATELQSVPISPTGPTTGQYLVFNGTEWVPANLAVPAVPAGRVFATGGNAVPSGLIPMAGTSYLTAGMAADPGGNGLKVPTTGHYLVTAQLSYGAVGANDQAVGVGIFINGIGGTHYATGNLAIANMSNDNGLVVSDIVPLNAADVVSIAAIGLTVTTALNTDPTLNYLSAVFVTP